MRVHAEDDFHPHVVDFEEVSEVKEEASFVNGAEEVMNEKHQFTVHLLSELPRNALMVALVVFTFFMVVLTTFDVTHPSSPVVTAAAVIRVVAWLMLSVYVQNSFLPEVKKVLSVKTAYNLISCTVVLTVLSFSMSFVGRTVFSYCGDSYTVGEEEEIDNDDVFRCNPLQGTGFLPSYFYLNVALLHCLQMSVNFQSFRALSACWTIIATSLLLFQIKHNSFARILIDDFMLGLFIYGSLTSARKSKSNFRALLERRRNHEAALQAEGSVQSMETRVTDMRRLIGDISHDLKTPMHAFSMELNTLQGQLLGMKKEGGVEGGEEWLDRRKQLLESVTTLQDACTFMLMTINRCLDYTKTSSGMSLVPKKSTVCLQEALQCGVGCVLRSQESVAGGGGMSVVLLPLSDQICTHVLTDYQWLVENILCLISNAVKFTTDGAGRITVSCKLVDDEGQEDVGAREGAREKAVAKARNRHLDRLRGLNRVKEAAVVQEEAPEHQGRRLLLFAVEDYGIGTSAEAKLTLFQPFQHQQEQAQRVSGKKSKKRMRQAGGTGLGLYSLAQRVSALEGHCGVRDREGHGGSVFWFSIPYLPDQRSANLIENSVRLTQRSHQSDDREREPHQMRVLVVDDSIVIQKSTTRFISKQGHTVDVASNGLMGLNMLTEGETKYDLVLMGE